MIFNDINILKDKSFPIIIIGSGPAGITIARKLEEKKISSLIVEAGDYEYNEDSQAYYKSKVIGDSITDLRDSRLRQLGGTSGLWGGWCKPIEKWNIKKWGLNFEEVSKYKDETCKILEIKNNFKKAKLDNYFNQIEFKYSKVRFAEKYKDKIKKSKYISLILNSQVTHLKGSNHNIKEAVISQNEKSYSLNSNFFILCGGGIENSRILLWTKIKSKGLLNENLPIGKYWMTHPWTLGGVGFLYKSRMRELLNNDFINYEGPMHISTSKNLVDDKKILSGAIYMNAKEDTKLYKEIIKDLLCVAPNYGKKIARAVFKKDLKCGDIFMNLEEPPSITNRIELDKNELDKNKVPITNLYYKQSKNTLISMKTILQELGKFFVKTNIGRVAIKENIENLTSYENLGVNHHMGGTRIGEDPTTSVVNKNLKVHFTNNLFICGSSTFTTGGYSNPTYTIVQLSLRLAEKLHSNIKTL